MPNRPQTGQHISRRPSSGRYRSPTSRPPPIELPGKKQNIRSLIHFFNTQASSGTSTPANRRLAPTTVRIPKNVVRARVTTFNRLETFSVPATTISGNSSNYKRSRSRSRSFPEPRRGTEDPRSIDKIVSGNVHHHRQQPDGAQYKVEEITVSGGDKREITYNSINSPFNSVRVWNGQIRRQNSSSSVQCKDGVIDGPPDLSAAPKSKHKHHKHKASSRNENQDLPLQIAPNKNTSVESIVAKPRKRKKSAVIVAQRAHAPVQRNEADMLDGKQSTTEELSKSTAGFGSLKGTLLSMFGKHHGGGEGSGAAGVEAPRGTVRERTERNERTRSSERTEMIKSPGKETEIHETRHEFSKITLRNSTRRESQVSKAKEVEEVTGDSDIQHELRTEGARAKGSYFPEMPQAEAESSSKTKLLRETQPEAHIEDSKAKRPSTGRKTSYPEAESSVTAKPASIHSDDGQAHVFQKPVLRKTRQKIDERPLETDAHVFQKPILRRTSHIHDEKGVQGEGNAHVFHKPVLRKTAHGVDLPPPLTLPPRNPMVMTTYITPVEPNPERDLEPEVPVVREVEIPRAEFQNNSLTRGQNTPRTVPAFFKDVAQKRREERKKAALALSTSDEHISVSPLRVVKATESPLPQQVQHTRASENPRAASPEDLKHMHDPAIHGFVMPKMGGPYGMGSTDTLTSFEEPHLSHVESSEESGFADAEIRPERSQSPAGPRQEPERSPSSPVSPPLEHTYTPLRSPSLMREMALPKLSMRQSRRSRPAADRKSIPVMTRPSASTVSLEHGIPRMKLKKDFDWRSSWRNRKANFDGGKDSRVDLNKADRMSLSSSSSHETTASSEIYRHTGALLQSQVHLTQSRNLAVDSSGVGELEDDTEWDDRSPLDVAVTSSSTLDSGDADERPRDEIPKTTSPMHRRPGVLRGPRLSAPKPLLGAPATISKRPVLQERQISFDGSVDGSVDSSPSYTYSDSGSLVLDRANVLDGGGEEADGGEEGSTSDDTFEDARECRKLEIRKRLDEERWGHRAERPRRKKGKQGRIGIADCQLL